MLVHMLELNEWASSLGRIKGVLETDTKIRLFQ